MSFTVLTWMKDTWFYCFALGTDVFYVILISFFLMINLCIEGKRGCIKCWSWPYTIQWSKSVQAEHAAEGCCKWSSLAWLMLPFVWVNMTLQVEVNASGLLLPAVTQVGGKIARMGMWVKEAQRACPHLLLRLPQPVWLVPLPAPQQQMIQAWVALYSAHQSVGFTDFFCGFLIYFA